MPTIFQLARPLFLDAGVGQQYFRPVDHNLDYRILQVDGDAQTMKIALVVADATDRRKAATLKEFDITPEGFPFGPQTNEAEIKAALDLKAQLEAGIAADKADIAALEGQKKALDAKIVGLDDKTEIDAANQEISAINAALADHRSDLAAMNAELAALQVPSPEFGRAFQFAQVIEFFDKGVLREAALPFVLAIKFQDRPISEWVEIIEK